GVGAQLAALSVIALLALTRVQGAVLIGVYVSAVVMYALTLAPGARRSYVQRYWPTALGVVGTGAVGAVGAAAARGGVLGRRSGTTAAIVLAEVPGQVALHAAALVVMTAVIPVVATVYMIVIGLSRRAAEPRRLFACVALPVVAGTIAVVAAASTTIDTEGAS